MVYSGDTGVCPEFWAAITAWMSRNSDCELKTILMECSFPNRLADFARRTGHMAPDLLFEDMKKASFEPPELLIFHMKPQHIEEIKTDIESVGSYRVRLLSPDQVFEI